MKVDLKLLNELIQTLESSGLTEIEVKHGDEAIRLRKDATRLSHAPVASTTLSGARVPREAQEVVEDDPNAHYVTSPFVGTFYRAANPEGDPFVQIGDIVKPGQTLCIIEAMKLMNEIEAEIDGTIVEALVENGKPVEYGDRLFKIKS